MFRFSRGQSAIWVAAFLASCLVSSCSLAKADQPKEPVQVGSSVQGSPSHQPLSVVAERGDITPVVTLPATVRTNVRFTVTAPEAGRIELDPPMIVLSGDGNVVEFDMREYGGDPSSLVQDGEQVPEGLPIFQVTHSGFVISAEISTANLLRLREKPVAFRGQISGAGSPFDCDPLDPRPSRTPEGSMSLHCRVPPNQPALEGLEGILAVQLPGVSDVITLPVEAVAGSVERGSVFLEDPTTSPTPHSIDLGVTDGVNIEVRSGLSEGDVVYIPSPSLIEN